MIGRASWKRVHIHTSSSTSSARGPRRRRRRRGRRHAVARRRGPRPLRFQQAQGGRRVLRDGQKLPHRRPQPAGRGRRAILRLQLFALQGAAPGVAVGVQGAARQGALRGRRRALQAREGLRRRALPDDSVLCGRAGRGAGDEAAAEGDGGVQLAPRALPAGPARRHLQHRAPRLPADAGGALAQIRARFGRNSPTDAPLHPR